MNRRLFWKLCLIIVTGTVTLFYVINILTSRAEEGMSFLAQEDRQQLREWGHKAEQLTLAGDEQALAQWITNLQAQEKTWVAVVRSGLTPLGGSDLNKRFYQGYTIGRDIDWKVHLYFADNPIMEVSFVDPYHHFLILLPDRMRPGVYWGYTSVALQIILPMILLSLLSIILYRHIMAPLKQLKAATQAFTAGKFDARVGLALGSRADELTELAATFDQMAARIGELIIGQRQLIADLSHELRTPLTRLDIALDQLHSDDAKEANLERISRESSHIRRLVEDTLTLAWLENERPDLQQESIELIDLLDVLLEDARFEFPGRNIETLWPDKAELHHSNHRALGQALENILRNALRYTPTGEAVSVRLKPLGPDYQIDICDSGPGVPAQYLQTIFQPFFRIETSRQASGNGFGLGLALAKRQIIAVGGRIEASNIAGGGLRMSIILPSKQM